MRIKNVLSLFDGMSCGQIALKEMGINPSIYYASEIDKHAITQTQLNFPDTVQLGSVIDVDVNKLERIDLLIGGSPCQSFSFAGKRKGMATKCEIEITKLSQYLELKEQGFEFEGQSYLFWEYMRILTDIRKYNPNVLFLLENVEMGAKWERVLSEAIGIYGVHINSALVSAQNRKRVYWTNIKTKQVGLFGELHSDIPQPADRGILLRDILEEDVDEKYYLSDKVIDNLLKHKEMHKGIDDLVCAKPHNFNTNQDKNNLIYQVNPSLEINITRITGQIGFKKQFKVSDKAQCLLARDCNGMSNNGINVVIQIPEATKKGYVEILPGECFDFENPNSKTRRGRKMEDKSNSLMAQNMSFMNFTRDYRIRRLTPSECAKLQTIQEWYKWECSDTQKYKMLGNGWTIEVIKHIFKFINNE